MKNRDLKIPSFNGTVIASIIYFLYFAAVVKDGEDFMVGVIIFWCPLIGIAWLLVTALFIVFGYYKEYSFSIFTHFSEPIVGFLEMGVLLFILNYKLFEIDSILELFMSTIFIVIIWRLVLLLIWKRKMGHKLA